MTTRVREIMNQSNACRRYSSGARVEYTLSRKHIGVCEQPRLVIFFDSFQHQTNAPRPS